MSTRIDPNPLTAPTAPMTSLEPELARGDLIGRYVVVETLGRGGMGTVYRAFDPQINRALAIKVLHRSLARGEGGERIVGRMLREARAMARLRHPNVVVIHDVGEIDGTVFLAMELVDGGTLRSWLKEEHALGERLATLIAAGRGLAAAHAAGLVHRDFKPDNVLVGKDGRVLVTDFGIAWIADDDLTPPTDVTPRSARPPIDADAPTTAPAKFELPDPESAAATAPLTVTGSVLGTIGFMAPEQALGEPTTAASDQFSFSVTLYLALYGTVPFPSKSLHGYIDDFHSPLPAPPTNAVPAWLHKVVARGLAPEPEERFPSMEALLAALEADPDVARRKRRKALVLATAGLAAIGAATWVAARPSLECAPDRADLRGVWDEPIRADLTASFARLGAGDVGARVAKVLDDTAARWTAMKADSCEATRIKHRQPEDAYRLRGECLDRRRDELREVASSLRSGDKAVVDKALSAAYGMTSIAVCADVPMLRTSGGLPDDATARAHVVEARGDIARAVSFQHVGKLVDATKAATHALDLARSASHPPTVAEALRILGALDVEQNDYGKAEPLLTDATWTAARAGADALVVDGASMTAFVVGSKLGRPGEARVWLGLAEAALARVGGSQELELIYSEHKAWLLSDAESRADEAIAIQERVVRAYESLYGVHPRTLRALYNLGDAETSIGNHARACELYARAAAMAEQIGGPGYEWVGYADEGRADCLAAQGDFAGGDAAIARALSIFEAQEDEYSQAEALEVVIRSALARGDDAKAAATSRRALALLAKLEGTASLRALVEVPSAEALLRAASDPAAVADEASRLCEDAQKQQELLGQIDPQKVLRADAFRCLAEARLAAGRARDAIAPLERSLAIPKRTYARDLPMARFAMARALVASGGDAGRATALAKQAAEELAATPWLAVDRAAVEKWIAARE